MDTRNSNDRYRSAERSSERYSERYSDRDDYAARRSAERSSQARRTVDSSRRTSSSGRTFSSATRTSARTSASVSSRTRGSSSAQRGDSSARRSSYSSQGETRSSRSRASRASERPVYVGGQQPSALEAITGNRVVLIGIIVVALVVLIGLVTCVSGALGARSGEDAGAGSEASASAEAASGSASASGASASASAAATTGVQSPWTDDGTFTTGDSVLDNYIKKVCDDHSQSGATYEQNAYDTYIYVSRCDYVERENNQSPWGEKWDVEFAKQFFEEGDSGSCYNYAAVIEYVLKYFGYSDAEGEPCVVKLQSGAWGDHGLVFVTNKADGKRCIIDPALSANGWMLGIDDYDYDVRNIGQNSTIDGNVEALLNNDVPTPIPPGELTEPASSSSASATTDDAGEEGMGAEGDLAYEDGTTEEVNYDEAAEGYETQDDGTYYEE